MNEKELNIDLKCHAIYSKRCKKIILNKLSFHYEKNEVQEIFEKIQNQYVKFLHEFNHQDLGGNKNFHNKLGGTYDCIMLVSYYVVCKETTSFKEIQEMAESLTVSTLKLNFVDLNKPVFKRLMYYVFKGAKKRCVKWHDFDMQLDPYYKDKPLHYSFTKCPFADFIHQFKLEEIAGALCNVDYACMNAINTKLVRKHTCIKSDCCDYTFYSKNDPILKKHPEYIDELGFIRNK